MSVFKVLEERGYIKQLTHAAEIEDLFAKERVTFYIGFDPTADSLHVGHFLGLMVMSHMQKAGHRPICLIGGGTTMIGDPSGKTDMRRIMSAEEIEQNGECFKRQMAKFIDFSGERAIMVNNADWLLKLNYVEMLREVGVHFSVNRMLGAECFKQRLERGLSFFEFNYMLMQSYDFWKLFCDYDCVLQMGGDDQWSNILAGADLIRRKESKAAYGLTFTLLTTNSGQKMGKTVKGALWLDPKKTAPYDFYQYWRNIDDADVEKCLALLTFLPMDKVRALGSLRDEKINEAKKILAYEVTKLIHGEDEALKAGQTAEALFGGAGTPDTSPGAVVGREALGAKLIDVLYSAGAFASKSEGRRLVAQGGLYLNNEKVEDVDLVLSVELFENDALLVRKGKKSYFRLLLDKV